MLISFEEFRPYFLDGVENSALTNEVVPSVAFLNELISNDDYERYSQLETSCFFSFKEGTKAYKNMYIDAGYIEIATNSLQLCYLDFNKAEIGSINREFIYSKATQMLNFVENSLKGFFKDKEQSAAYTQLAIEIIKNKSDIYKIQLIIFSTNIISNRLNDVPKIDFEHQGQKFLVEIVVIDMDSIYRTLAVGEDNQELIIKTNDYGLKGIQCLKADINNPEYDAYVAIVPGKFLANIYKEHASDLLSANVRSFLNVRGGVNKGIKATIILEPDKFFTYNNGISAIAKNAVIERLEEKGDCFVEFTDLKIINGGQTTASLASADINGQSDLSSIFVMMKLTILKKPDPVLVNNISKFANTQNKVNASDLESNIEYFTRIKELSSRIYAPQKINSFRKTSWFFEQSKGSYEQPMMSMRTKERASYLEINPKSQKLTKTDIAKYINSFDLRPFDVSWGAQVNASRFITKVKSDWDKDPSVFNDLYFYDLVAKAILFKHIEKTVSNLQWYIDNKAYRAQIVTYTFSKIVFEIRKQMNKEINWKTIWDNQTIPESFDIVIANSAKLVFDVIYASDRPITNIGEYCKRKECWEEVKSRSLTLPKNMEFITTDLDGIKAQQQLAKKEFKNTTNIVKEVEIYKLGPEYWKKMLDEADKQKFISSTEKALLEKAIRYSKFEITQLFPKDANEIWRIKTELESMGLKISKVASNNDDF